MNAKEAIVGLVYHPDYLIHTQAQHPERKERLEYLLAALSEQAVKERVSFINPAPATVDQLSRVHERSHIHFVEEACRQGRRFIDMDTYIVPQSYSVALLAAGGALAGLKTIMEDGHIKQVFAFTRPPGHHAERGRAMGFCLFNNIAVAAAAARQEYGLKRVAIVDWDVHHGNGTEQIFFEDPAVLFISVHQSPAYPGTGQISDVGRGAGAGYNINIPLPGGSGDADYLLCLEKVIVPVLDCFKPEILLISAGQDAYCQDPLAGMDLTIQGYYRMAEILSGVAERCCDGRVLLCLEGGYHLTGQAGAVRQVLNAVGGWGLPVEAQSSASKPSAAAVRRLDEVITVQKKFWPLPPLISS